MIVLGLNRFFDPLMKYQIQPPLLTARLFTLEVSVHNVSSPTTLTATESLILLGILLWSLPSNAKPIAMCVVSLTSVSTEGDLMTGPRLRSGLRAGTGRVLTSSREGVSGHCAGVEGTEPCGLRRLDERRGIFGGVDGMPDSLELWEASEGRRPHGTGLDGWVLKEVNDEARLVKGVAVRGRRGRRNSSAELEGDVGDFFRGDVSR